jgi:hypothetical protein
MLRTAQAADVAFKLQILAAEPAEFATKLRGVLTSKGLATAGFDLGTNSGVMANKVAGVVYKGTAGSIGAKSDGDGDGDGDGDDGEVAIGMAGGGSNMMMMAMIVVVLVVLVVVMVMRYRKQKRQKDAFFEKLDQDDDDNALDDDNDDEWQ